MIGAPSCIGISVLRSSSGSSFTAVWQIRSASPPQLTFPQRYPSHSTTLLAIRREGSHRQVIERKFSNYIAFEQFSTPHYVITAHTARLEIARFRQEVRPRAEVRFPSAHLENSLSRPTWLPSSLLTYSIARQQHSTSANCRSRGHVGMQYRNTLQPDLQSEPVSTEPISSTGIRRRNAATGSSSFDGLRFPGIDHDAIRFGTYETLFSG